jgi:hypothetical protein
MHSSNNEEIPGTLIQDSKFGFIFTPSNLEDLKRYGRLRLRSISTQSRLRPAQLSWVPLGFPLENSSTGRNQILTLLWDSGPMTPLDMSVHLAGMSFNSVYKRLCEMARWGDVRRISKGRYCLPHQADSGVKLQDNGSLERKRPLALNIPGFPSDESSKVRDRILRILWEIDSSIEPN